MKSISRQTEDQGRPSRTLGGLLRWAAYGLIGFACLAGVGAVYQALAEARDMRQYPPPGTLVDVGDHRLHIHCMGEGTPTVVLEAGLMGSSLDWSLVQPEASRFTRVCAYDRAGNGWSDPGPKPHTPQRVTSELHTLLDRAGLEGPYVLVGHSLGGMYVRVYAGKYPGEVVGMVLVDAQSEDEWKWVPTGFVWAPGVHQLDLKSYGRPILARLGVMRFLRKPSGPVNAWPPAVRAAATAIGLRSRAFDWILCEGPPVKETAEQVRAAGPVGDIPLIVLSAPRNPPPGVSHEKFDARWLELQAKLAQLSPQGRHIIADNSNHYIHLSRPELVIDAIWQTVEATRRNASENGGRGSGRGPTTSRRESS